MTREPRERQPRRRGRHSSHQLKLQSLSPQYELVRHSPSHCASLFFYFFFGLHDNLFAAIKSIGTDPMPKMRFSRCWVYRQGRSFEFVVRTTRSARRRSPTTFLNCHFLSPKNDDWLVIIKSKTFRRFLDRRAPNSYLAFAISNLQTGELSSFPLAADFQPAGRTSQYRHESASMASP